MTGTLTVTVLLLPLARAAALQMPESPVPYLVGGQATAIWQYHPNFHSPYEGPNSLRAASEDKISQTYTLYTGVRLLPWLELYANPEMVRGAGLSDALGVAGFPNGEVIRNPSVGTAPYLGRLFLRAIIPLTDETDSVATALTQIAGERASERLTITFGILATNDIFDTNRYANSPRTQFMNWSLFTDPAYDFAADTRGYSRGVAVEWTAADFAVRAGVFQMPTVANGIDLDSDLIHAQGSQIEAELHPNILLDYSLVLRGLFYGNHARMGNYRESLALAQEQGTTPDITATRERGRLKYGFALNAELPVTADGDTGLFARCGWNDGTTESFAFTETDSSVSVGTQLGGAFWHRADDRLGMAFVQNDISNAHAAYLAAGGLGFILGDGRLNRGRETIFETYYSLQVLRWLALSLDYQFIADPGYNRDRGPVSVLSVRGHIEGVASALPH